MNTNSTVDQNELYELLYEAKIEVEKYEELIKQVEIKQIRYQDADVDSDLNLEYLKLRSDWKLRVSQLRERIAFLPQD